VGCTIVTIERPSPDRLYMCAPSALGFLPSKVFALNRGDDRFQADSTKNRPVLVSAEILATHTDVQVAEASMPHRN
jgi:hypothetical protein